MSAKKGIPRAEAPRQSLQNTCAACRRAYVEHKGQTCAACRAKKRTRQHSLDQSKLGGR